MVENLLTGNTGMTTTWFGKCIICRGRPLIAFWTATCKRGLTRGVWFCIIADNKLRVAG